jgi:hypothetical protein
VAFQPCPNIASLTAQYAILDADLAINTFHVYNPSGWGSGSLLAIAESYAEWENTAVMGVPPFNNRTTTTTLQAVVARDLSTDTGDEVSFSGSPLPIVGTIEASQGLPSANSKAIKLYTGVPGRSYRGRIFWIDVSSTQLTSDPNSFNSAILSYWTAAYSTLIANINGSRDGNAIGVLSRVLNGAIRAAGILTPYIGAAIVNTAVDVQRRRLPYHARHR